MAPGPVLGQLLADRRLRRARRAGSRGTRASPAKFRTAINQSLAYAQAHPDEIRDLLPGGDAERPAADLEPARRPRRSSSQLAQYAKEFGVITTLPNLTELVPSTITGGKTLQGAVGNRFILLRLDGKAVTRLDARAVHVRRHRLVEDAELPARRARA